MSHSVFRDLDDDDNSSGNISKGAVADSNIVVFIDKNGDVTVDPNALQDFVVSADDDNNKSTVSVIRVGSPTPSMESKEHSSDQEDNDDEQRSDEDKDNDSVVSDEDSDADLEAEKSRKLQKNKKKNKARGVSLIVEEFYNPQQAVALATEIKKIAGITNPKQLKADYDHLRYIIQNDHCYTPYTYADTVNEASTNAKSDSTSKKDAKLTKGNQKGPATSTTNVSAKKPTKSPFGSKANGLDTSDSGNKRTAEDTNSSVDNTERTSDEEEAESETDFSDFSEDESDNDRDSDLDFSVNDAHSRRAKKMIKKKKAQAKRLAGRKRRQSTIDAGSDDGSTPNRKKLSKKSLNTSSKSTNAGTPKVSSSIRSPVASSTPRITKVIKTEVSRPSEITEASAPKAPERVVKEPVKVSVSEPIKSQIIQKTTITSTTTNLTSTSNPNRPKSMIIVRQQSIKKPMTDTNKSFNVKPILFKPDTPQKVQNPTSGPFIMKPQPSTSISAVTNRQTATIVQSSSIVQDSISTQANQHIPRPIITTMNKIRTPTMKLESEQDKQLDLINSLVQEELSKSVNESKAPISSHGDKTIKVIPAAIPSIVKMLETSETSETTTSIQTAELPSIRTTTSSIGFDPSADSQMLPDDLLESFVNSDDCLTDDLMQHVVKLVEDKNIQEILDQQLLGVQPMVSTPSPIAVPSTTMNIPQTQQTTTSTDILTPKSNIVPVRQIQSKYVSDDKLSSINKTPNYKREPILIKKSNGQIITLPPIEAPATRGAKRRAEGTPTSGQQKPKLFTVIVQSESNQQSRVTTTTTTTIANHEKKFDNYDADNAIIAKQITPRERRASVAVKRTSFDSKPKRSMSISNPPATDDDNDDDDDGSDGSYNSEDDPHRLWCICRTPHNNRFMICCDKCEEWFHGKCVGVNKSMGADMEKRGVDWICPNCQAKQQPSIKNIFPREMKRSVGDATTTKSKEAGSSASTVTVTAPTSITTNPTSQSQSNCIVCCVKPSRNNSVYCSDDCIRKHAMSTTKVGTTTTTTVIATSAPVTNQSQSISAASTSTPKIINETTPESQKKSVKLTTPLFRDRANHVVCIDKTTGKFLTGKSAPTIDNLQKWLDDHPTHEVLRPGTPQANAFKEKQLQLKSLASRMEAEKELFAVSQPMKVQSTLRFSEGDKRMVFGVGNKPTTPTAGIKRTFSTTTPSPNTSTKSSTSVHEKSIEPAAKTPKLSTTPVQRPIITKKRSADELKTYSTAKTQSGGKPNDKDRIRENARKALIEQLIIRTKEISDPNAPKLTEDEIKAFVKAAESQMYAMFGNDTNTKYKAKYRSLMFNIKDRKNLTLFEKISNKSIEPKQLVKLSPEEMASQELAKWRENENKHQLEMITKSELDSLACGQSYVLKTHKGEEVIQDSGDRISLDPSIAVQDVVSVLNNNSTVSSSSEIGGNASAANTSIVKDGRYDKYLLSGSGKSGSSKKDSQRGQDKKERDRNDSRSSGSSKHKRKRSRERHSSHTSHSHKDKKDREKDKKERSSSDKKDKKDHKSGSSSSSSSSGNKHHSSTDKDRKSKKPTDAEKPTVAPKIQRTDDDSISDKIRKAESTIKSILHPEEFKKTLETTSKSVNSIEASTISRQTSAATESDQEPTSTVMIPTPPECTPEQRSTTPPPSQAENVNAPIFWSGTINMVDVATFQVSLSVLSGNAVNIALDADLDVVGRIPPGMVWDYLEKIRISKDVALLKFIPQSGDDASAYETFMSYLNERRRLGVFKQSSKLIKDFYVLPLQAHEPLPSNLKNIFNCDLEPNHPALLLGVIVKNRGSAPIPAKIVQRRTVPFPTGHKPTVTPSIKETHYTPPSSPDMNTIANKPSHKPFSTNVDDDEPYSPGGSDEDDLGLTTLPSTFLAGASTTLQNDSQIQREVEELNRQIEAEKKQIALHLQSADTSDLTTTSHLAPVWDTFGHFGDTKNVDEPYSPSNSVSPPINTNLSDVVSKISIPANLADILQNVASFGATSSTQMPVNQYTAASMDTGDEYVPIATTSNTSMMSYGTTLQPTSTVVSSEPSKLAQLTDEELLRLVPDEIEY